MESSGRAKKSDLESALLSANLREITVEPLIEYDDFKIDQYFTLLPHLTHKSTH